MAKHLLVSLFLLIAVARPALAQGRLPSPAPSLEATPSMEATPSGIVEKVIEPKQDITQPTGEVKSKLERVLEENPAGELSVKNFMRWSIERAVERGVPVNTIVLLLLFPLIAAIVAASRHLIGMRGYGIFTPAVLSVALLASGIGVGILLFLVIILVATLARVILRRLKLQYLPRMAFLLWFVAFGVFAVIYLATYANFSGLITVGIFPILILILLAETFMDVQAGRSMREALSVTVETLVLAIIVSFIVGLEFVQLAVLLYPEIVFFGVGLFDIFMGKYVGLRLFELARFRELVGEQEE